VIGAVCVGVSLAGYRSVLDGFLDDTSGSQGTLLAALDAADLASIPALSHAVKGAAASLGLRAIQAQAQQIEAGAAAYDSADCQRAAADLRARLGSARALLQRMGFV
jgi:HPt (histidine-containing phosphotransfer) domain-containing protein